MVLQTTYSFRPEQNIYSFKDCFGHINECMQRIRFAECMILGEQRAASKHLKTVVIED